METGRNQMLKLAVSVKPNLNTYGPVWVDFGP
jgi:hypothetical protein